MTSLRDGEIKKTIRFTVDCSYKIIDRNVSDFSVEGRVCEQCGNGLYHDKAYILKELGVGGYFGGKEHYFCCEGCAEEKYIAIMVERMRWSHEDHIVRAYPRVGSNTVVG